MLSYMSKTMLTTSYGKWDVDVSELLLGKFMGEIPSFFCIYTDSRLEASPPHVKWDPSNPNANFLHSESLYQSAVFYSLLACQEPVKAYNLSKMGIRYIEDVVDDQGHILSFPQIMAKSGLRMHHMPIWRKIKDLLQPLSPIPLLSHDDKLFD